MSHYLTSLIMCLLLSLSLPYASAAENSQSQQHTILIMGDSISAGYGIDKAQGWVSLLKTRLSSLNTKTQYKIVNSSISGETTSGGANRIKSLLKQHKPMIVVLELGGNDGLRGSSIKLLEQNLSFMINESKNVDAHILLLGMQIPPNYGQTYSRLFKDMYPKIAREHNITLLPFLLEGIAGQPEMMQADGIHPTTSAQPIMMEAVWSQLKTWIH